MEYRTFPKKLQIQTTTACGADCTMCPHPVTSPAWSNGRMDSELFNEIVEQLRNRPVEYIAPYLMADPLADKHIDDRIRQLRSAVPDATIEISTTGKYLVPSIVEKLLKSPLSELRVSCHGITASEFAETMPGVDFEKAMANLQTLIRRWQQNKPFKLAIVCLWGLWSQRREREIEAFWADQGVEIRRWRVTSRAKQVDLTIFGNAEPDPTLWTVPNQQPPFRCRHHRDTEWVHILSDGRVTLCCMDYKQEVILGDLREQSIEAIFNNDRFRTIRAKIQGHAPTNREFLCHRCEWHVSESRLKTRARPPLANPHVQAAIN